MMDRDIISPITSKEVTEDYSTTKIPLHLMNDAPVITSLMSAFLILNTMIGSGIFNQRAYYFYYNLITIRIQESIC